MYNQIWEIDAGFKKKNLDMFTVRHQDFISVELQGGARGRLLRWLKERV